MNCERDLYQNLILLIATSHKGPLNTFNAKQEIPHLCPRCDRSLTPSTSAGRRIDIGTLSPQERQRVDISAMMECKRCRPASREMFSPPSLKIRFPRQRDRRKTTSHGVEGRRFPCQVAPLDRPEFYSLQTLVPGQTNWWISVKSTFVPI